MFDFAPQRPEPKIVSQLRAARALVATPEQWCQNIGLELRATGLAHCVGNALASVTTTSFQGGLHDFARTTRLFMRVIPSGCVDIQAWNDVSTRTHAEVLAAFDAAIALGLSEAETHAHAEVAHV